MEVNCIKVTNIPANVYDDYLVITFATVVEGLEVKTRVIRFDAEKATAIVDVETSEAVKKILRDYQKHPSTYDVNGKRLHVVEFTLPGLTEAFEQMKRNQVVFAECLELQCLDLADFPQTVWHVQRSAYSAMALHGDTVTLFQKFSVTASHIALTLVLGSFDGIVLKEPSFVAFNEVLSCVTEMSSGADHIHSRYGALVSKIVECGKEIATAEDARKNENRAEINELDEQLREAGITLCTLQERLEECGKRRDELQQMKDSSVDIEQPRDSSRPDALVFSDNQSEQQNNCDNQVSGQPLGQIPQAEVEQNEAVKAGYEIVPNDKRKQGMEKCTGRGTKGDPVEESSTSLFSGWGKRMKSAASSVKDYAEETAVTNVQPKAAQDRRRYDAGIAGDQAVATKHHVLVQCSEQDGPVVGGHKDKAIRMGFVKVPHGKPKVDGMAEEGSKSRWSLPKPSSWGHGNSALEEKRRRQKLNLQKQMEETDAQMTDICSKIEAKYKHIRELEEQKRQKEAETPINAEGVCDAVNYVKDVMLHLSKICEFWTTMSQNIQPLADEQGASHVYRSAIESDSVKKTFLEKMSLSQQGSERLNALCMDYVRHFQQDPVEGLGRIFAFLSAPIGQPREVIEARTSELRRDVTRIA